MKDIEQYSNEELLEELSERCSPFIFIGHRIEEGGLLCHWWRWGGNDALCYGLCFTLSHYIQKQMVNEEINHLKGE